MVSAIRERTYKKNEAGVALLESGDIEGAAAVFSDCILTNPTFSPAFYNRAMAFNMLERHKEASVDILEFLKLSKGTAYGYNLAGDIMVKLESYQEAVGYYTQAIEMCPLPSFFYRRGVALCSMGNCVAGYEDICEAAELGAEEAQKLLSQMHEDTKRQRAATCAP